MRKSFLYLLPLAFLHVQCKTPNSESQTLATASPTEGSAPANADAMTIWLGFRAPTVPVEQFAERAQEARRRSMWIGVAPAAQLKNGVFARAIPEVALIGTAQDNEDHLFDAEFYKFADVGKSNRYAVVRASDAEKGKGPAIGSQVNAYDLLGTPWTSLSGGTTIFRVRALKPSDPADALKALLAHAKAQATAGAKKGLNGYIVVVDRGFAFEAMNWSGAASPAKDGAALAALSAAAPIEFAGQNP